MKATILTPSEEYYQEFRASNILLCGLCIVELECSGKRGLQS